MLAGHRIPENRRSAASLPVSALSRCRSEDECWCDSPHFGSFCCTAHYSLVCRRPFSHRNDWTAFASLCCSQSTPRCTEIYWSGSLGTVSLASFRGQIKAELLPENNVVLHQKKQADQLPTERTRGSEIQGAQVVLLHAGYFGLDGHNFRGERIIIITMVKLRWILQVYLKDKTFLFSSVILWLNMPRSKMVMRPSS